MAAGSDGFPLLRSSEMAGMYAWVGAFTLAAFMVSEVGAVRAQVSDAVPAPVPPGAGVPEQITFKLPALPLAAALDAYSKLTGYAALVDGELAAGRVSAPVRGTYTPREALRRLLVGTGLTARYASETAFTLLAEDDARTQGGDRGAPGAIATDRSPALRRYAGIVQTTLKRALCPSAQTRPGQYRAAMQLWIDKSGVVRRVHLLASTGLKQRDAAIERVLAQLVIDQPPPPALPQPLTLLLVPTATGEPEQCGAAAH
jgi:hypothetical protein